LHLIRHGFDFDLTLSRSRWRDGLVVLVWLVAFASTWLVNDQGLILGAVIGLAVWVGGELRQGGFGQANRRIDRIYFDSPGFVTGLSSGSTQWVEIYPEVLNAWFMVLTIKPLGGRRFQISIFRDQVDREAFRRALVFLKFHAM